MCRKKATVPCTVRRVPLASPPSPRQLDVESGCAAVRALQGPIRVKLHIVKLNIAHIVNGLPMRLVDSSQHALVSASLTCSDRPWPLGAARIAQDVSRGADEGSAPLPAASRKGVIGASATGPLTDRAGRRVPGQSLPGPGCIGYAPRVAPITTRSLRPCDPISAPVRCPTDSTRS